MTITSSKRSKDAGRRRRPRHRFARGHAEPADRPTKPATATARSSQIHPTGVVDHILAIQQTTQRPAATLPPPLSP